jgi:hypothetical protein
MAKRQVLFMTNLLKTVPTLSYPRENQNLIFLILVHLVLHLTIYIFKR